MEREWNGSLHGTYPPDDHKIISSGSFSIKQVLCVSYILLLAHFHRSWVPQGPLWSLLSLRQQPVLQVLRQLFNRQQDPSGHFDDYYVKLPVHLQLQENYYPKPQYKLPILYEGFTKASEFIIQLPASLQYSYSTAGIRHTVHTVRSTPYMYILRTIRAYTVQV